MVQHHSCPDSERDHKLLRPLTFTLIKDQTPLFNLFFPPLIASLCEGSILWHGPERISQIMTTIILIVSDELAMCMFHRLRVNNKGQAIK